MKKHILSMLLCLMISASLPISALAHSCVDKDRDYWCDECGMLISHTCIDANKDTWCDKCSCWIPHTCADKDADHLCDQCGKVMDVNIRVTVSSYLSADQHVNLTFYEGRYPSVIANIYGLTAEHTFTCAANSYFQLIVDKYGHPARTFYYNTKNSDIDIDAELYPYGDVSQDGKLNMGDAAKAYAHIKGTSVLTDEYAQDCADASGDGKLNMGDVAKIYAHIRGTNQLW